MVEILIIYGIDFVALIILGAAFARIEKNEVLISEKAKERNDKWHRNKWFFLLLIFGNISYIKYGLLLESALLLIGQFALVPLVFNPSINLNKGNPFFYLSDEGAEGIAKRFIGEKLYYLLFLGILAVTLIWIV